MFLNASEAQLQTLKRTNSKLQKREGREVYSSNAAAPRWSTKCLYNHPQRYKNTPRAMLATLWWGNAPAAEGQGGGHGDVSVTLLQGQGVPGEG